jgi:hypothetical protein
MRYRIEWGQGETVTLSTLSPFLTALEAQRPMVVRLPDGRRVRPTAIRSITALDDQGQHVRTWDPRAHGLDGGHDWQEAWRAVARATDGIRQEDPRRPVILAVLEELEAADRQRDALAWVTARARLHRALAGQHPDGRGHLAAGRPAPAAAAGYGETPVTFSNPSKGRLSQRPILNRRLASQSTGNHRMRPV